MAPLRPLIIDATAKAKAARVLAHAEKNHYRPGPDVPPPGDHERFVAYLNTYLAASVDLGMAESELGRLALRGELKPVLATAGADYARHWRGYIASLSAERWARCGW